MKKFFLCLSLLVVPQFIMQGTGLDDLLKVASNSPELRGKLSARDWIVDQAISGDPIIAVNVNSKTSDGKSLIELLNVFYKQSRNMTLVEKVIMAPDFDINGQNFNGMTILMRASAMADLDLINALLKVPKIDVNARNQKGNTALKFAKYAQEKFNNPNAAAVIERLKAAGAVE